MPDSLSHKGKSIALILALLATAFLGRVLGQAIAAVAAPQWLPPMAEWYSGVVPYRVLLPVQLLILTMQVLVSWSVWHGTGLFAKRRPRVGPILRWVAIVYFAAMVVRYIFTMAVYPEHRWFGHAIPIVFHWVLAAYLFVWSRYHSSEEA